jgi:hypothetical protein
MAVIANPNIADRSNSNWWVAPIGVGDVLPAPVLVSDLPVADPHVVGALYSTDNTTILISEG